MNRKRRILHTSINSSFLYSNKKTDSLTGYPKCMNDINDARYITAADFLTIEED